MPSPAKLSSRLAIPNIVGRLVISLGVGIAYVVLKTPIFEARARVQIGQTGGVGPFESAEVLAALNTLEFMWRAGHVPLDRVQALVRDLKLAEPADRIPRYLLSVK